MSEILQQLSDAMADAVERAGQSIVRVEGRRRLPATGIVWDGELIVTAHHVVERAEGIRIGLPNGEIVEATLVGRDPNTDLAVLRAATGLNPLARPDDDLRVGSLVLAVGRPGKDLQATLGVVSAIGLDQPDSPENRWAERQAERAARRAERMAERAARRGMAWSFSYSTAGSGVMMEGAIQTDVVMYPGFSGGPLIDASGTARGMNTSALTGGASLAVPVKTIARVVETLVQHGKMRKGFLGIGAQPVRLPEALAAEIGQETGLLLMQVEAGSPAERGGMFIGDIIVALDGQSVRSLEELMALLNSDRVGREVPAHVVRGGQVTQLSVTVGEKL
jgi:S1-C subfamily serine protease